MILFFSDEDFRKLLRRIEDLERSLGNARCTVIEREYFMGPIKRQSEVQPSGLFERIEKLEKAIFKKKRKGGSK